MENKIENETQSGGFGVALFAPSLVRFRPAASV